ncbi:MAG: FtsQ-type POTRA domain-containing protein, partial [Actinomycetota bacterium]|nr:FtsQ-type POTRA domain-containing protein [Actinomycetota bacterium]
HGTAQQQSPTGAHRFAEADHKKLGARRSTMSGRMATSGRHAAAPPEASRPIRRWLPWVAGGLTVLAAVGGLAWVLLASSLFDARSVQVVGVQELSAEVVRTVAAVPLGTPMLRLDTGEIEARVAALPRVASVQVRWRLDGTVQIAVIERTPVAVVHRSSGVHLIDATGTDYATVPTAPPGLPELQVPKVGPRDARTAAALRVLTGLPSWLRVQVRSITATSPADVVLQLDNGRAGISREVRWGDTGQGDRKAAVLGPLLTQPGKIYDVSSPALPTIA